MYEQNSGIVLGGEGREGHWGEKDPSKDSPGLSFDHLGGRGKECMSQAEEYMISLRASTCRLLRVTTGRWECMGYM